MSFHSCATVIHAIKMLKAHILQDAQAHTSLSKTINVTILTDTKFCQGSKAQVRNYWVTQKHQGTG